MPGRLKLDIKGTHFVETKLCKVNPLEPSSYQYLEDPIEKRTGVSFFSRKKSEYTPRGFKPTSTFTPGKPDLL